MKSDELLSTLKNNGESYRALLRAIEDEKTNKKPRLETRAADDWIDEIDSPKHKLLARVQASELAGTESSNCRR